MQNHEEYINAFNEGRLAKKDEDKINAEYWLGYNNGILAERKRIIELIDDLDKLKFPYKSSTSEYFDGMSDMKDFIKSQIQLTQNQSQQTKPSYDGRSSPSVTSNRSRVDKTADTNSPSFYKGNSPILDAKGSSESDMMTSNDFTSISEVAKDKAADTFSKVVKEADKGDKILFDEANGVVKNLTKESLDSICQCGHSKNYHYSKGECIIKDCKCEGFKAEVKE